MCTDCVKYINVSLHYTSMDLICKVVHFFLNLSAKPYTVFSQCRMEVEPYAYWSVNEVLKYDILIENMYASTCNFLLTATYVCIRLYCFAYTFCHHFCISISTDFNNMKYDFWHCTMSCLFSSKWCLMENPLGNKVVKKCCIVVLFYPRCIHAVSLIHRKQDTAPFIYVDYSLLIYPARWWE